MTRKERLEDRNRQVRVAFAELERKCPQWKLQAILEETAKKFPPISTTTVSAIIKGTGKYSSKN